MTLNQYPDHSLWLDPAKLPEVYQWHNLVRYYYRQIFAARRDENEERAERMEEFLAYAWEHLEGLIALTGGQTIFNIKEVTELLPVYTRTLLAISTKAVVYDNCGQKEVLPNHMSDTRALRHSTVTFL